VGFLEDDQRMNVMLTRARKGIIVFGDKKTFEIASAGESRWKEWIHWCQQHGTSIVLDELVAR
jgi:hypothetical protein